MGSLMHARAAAALRCDRSGLTLTHSCQCGRIRRTNKLRPYLARQPRPNLSCEGGMKTHNVSSHRRRRVWWCLARRLPIRSYGDGDGNLFAKTAEHTPGLDCWSVTAPAPAPAPAPSVANISRMRSFLPRGRGKKPRFLPMSARPLSVWPATDLMDRKRQRQPQLLPCLCARAIDWTLGAFCEPKTQTLPWTGRSIDRSSWPAGRGLITDRRPAGRRGSKAQVMDDANAARSATQVISYAAKGGERSSEPVAPTPPARHPFPSLLV
jgi:hypothetical protein